MFSALQKPLKDKTNFSSETGSDWDIPVEIGDGVEEVNKRDDYSQEL